MTSKVKYLGELRTQATHLLSGNVILTDAPRDNHGKGEAFSPTDLVATALASCMLSIMGIAGRTHQIDIDGTEVEVNKIMTAAPRKIGAVEVTLHMPKNNYSEKDKAILENAARTCPVSLSLHPDLEQRIVFIW